jgi:hypothetical protein
MELHNRQGSLAEPEFHPNVIFGTPHYSIFQCVQVDTMRPGPLMESTLEFGGIGSHLLFYSREIRPITLFYELLSLLMKCLSNSSTLFHSFESCFKETYTLLTNIWHSSFLHAVVQFFHHMITIHRCTLSSCLYVGFSLSESLILWKDYGWFFWVNTNEQ